MVAGEFAIMQHGSPAEDLSAAFNDEEISDRMLVEGVLTAVELSFLIGADGGNPIGGFAVKVKCKLDEFGTVALVVSVEFSYFHFTLVTYSVGQMERATYDEKPSAVVNGAWFAGSGRLVARADGM